MEIVLALCAAGAYAVADYSGDPASRRVSPIVVIVIELVLAAVALVSITVS